MRKLWIAGFVMTASVAALAQTTIYKHVDSSGRVTYSNKPMKDATVVELEPLTTIPSTPGGSLQPQKSAALVTAPTSTSATATISEKPELKPAVALVTPTATPTAASFPSIDSQTQKRRDEGRRKILAEELEQEERALSEMRKLLQDEQQNPTLIAAVRIAQQAVEPNPAQQAEFRKNIDKASGRIRGLQATAAEHEKNIEALKKELGALKP
jgi:hypothetical protein